MSREHAALRHTSAIITAIAEEQKTDYPVKSDKLATQLSRLGLEGVPLDLQVSASASRNRQTVFITWDSLNTGRRQMVTANTRSGVSGELVSSVVDEINGCRPVTRSHGRTTTVMRLAAEAVTAARNSA